MLLGTSLSSAPLVPEGRFTPGGGPDSCVLDFVCNESVNTNNVSQADEICQYGTNILTLFPPFLGIV